MAAFASAPAFASAADVTSTWYGQTGDWNNAELWRNSNGSITFPDNGNLGLTYDAVINSGTVTLTQNVTIDDLYLNRTGAVDQGKFSLTLAVGGSWTNGQLQGAGVTVIAPGATYDIGGGGSQVLLGQTLLNQGTINFSDSFANSQTLMLDRAGRIVNQGTFNITADGHIGGDGTGAFTNAGTLVKSGTGVAVFENGVTFNNTGTVNVVGGTLELLGPGTHGGSFVVNKGTNFLIGGGLNQFQSTSRITGAGTVYFDTAGSTTIAGAYNVTRTIVRGDAPSVGFDSPAVSSVLAVAGGSVFIDSTMQSNAVTVSGGKFSIDPGGQLTATAVTLGGGTTIVAPVAGIGAVGLRAAAVPAISGPILSAQTLNVVSGSNICGPGGTILVGSGGLLFTGNSSPTLTLDSDSATPGLMQLQGDVTFSGADGTAAIVNSGPVPIAGTIDLQGAQRTFTINDGAQPIDMQVSARLINGSLDKAGAGTLQLSGGSTYSGGTTIGGGVLEIDSAAALGTAPVTFAGGTLRLASAGPAAVSNALFAAPTDSIGLDIGAGNYQMGRLTLGTALNVAGAGSLSFAGPIAMTAAGPTTINSAASVTFIGPVTGGAGLILTPGGTLTFTGAGANTYGGATQVIGSTLVLSKPSGVVAVPGDLALIGAANVLLNASGQIAAGSNVSFNSAGGSPVLNLNGQTQTVATISSIQSGAGTIQLGAGTLTVAPNSGATIFSGSLQGSGRLVKSGASTLTLAAANSFGGLTVGGGVLKLAADQHVDSLISTGGQLDVQASQLFVAYPLLGFSPAATLRTTLQSGAITSSLDGSTTRVGLADSADGADPSLPSHTILLKRTRIGDLNLDGTVNFSDLLLLAQHYGQTNRNWDQGDLNYDGSVNFSDLLSLAQNYGQATPAIASPTLAQVPEPVTLDWLVLLPLLARRTVNFPPHVRKQQLCCPK